MKRRIPVFVAVLLIILAVSTASAQNLRRTVFPQGGWGGGWSCDFFITNQGLLTANAVKISFYEGSGSGLVVQTTDLGPGSSFQFDLPAGQTKVIRTSGGANTVAGYAELIAPEGASIRGTMVVRLVSGGQTSTQLGVSEQYPFSHYSFAAEVGPGVDTGIAFANPRLSYATTLPIDLVFTAIDRNGTILGTKTVALAAGEHRSLFLGGATGLFPGINFVGTVSVTAPDHFALLALRLEGGALGTVSINEGPVLSPYFVNQQATPEIEANDSTAAAHPIASLPAVVSGVILTKDDIDYFKFTGQQGQIANVLVRLPANSKLDSEIFLENSAGETIAWNDQNGLGGPFSAETDLPELGSFMTVILPADGTYYIKLWDWVGEFGGSDYTYEIHVSVQAP
ncbi:MAG: hypothetical protein ACE15E_24120 [Acidobacteriota bacterium]